ncbi:MAG: hypothetical protein NZ765_12050, partial [Anaerolineae bacterium]|nr:hypothetical protein [Anaerolineae bacterium]
MAACPGEHHRNNFQASSSQAIIFLSPDSLMQGHISGENGHDVAIREAQEQRSRFVYRFRKSCEGAIWC